IEGCRPFIAPHFNLTVELPLKAIVRGYSYETLPISWRQRKHGTSSLLLQEMGSRYLFIVLYVWLEKVLTRGDYRRPPAGLFQPSRRPAAVHLSVAGGGARALRPPVRRRGTEREGRGVAGPVPGFLPALGAGRRGPRRPRGGVLRVREPHPVPRAVGGRDRP